MAKIIVIQHEHEQGPGRLGATLRDHGFKLDIRRPDLTPEKLPRGTKREVPVDLDDVHGLVVLGGRVSANDSSIAYFEPLRELIRLAHDASLPVIGICLGHQLVAQALGGKVEAAKSPEVGFTQVNIPAGPPQTEPLLAGIAWSSPQFQLHEDEVTEMPSGATLLSSSEACKVQAFLAGHRTLGFQYHFEYDRSQIERMASVARSSFEKGGLNEQDLANQLDNNYEMFARLADRLCVNLATYTFPVPSLTSV